MSGSVVLERVTTTTTVERVIIVPAPASALPAPAPALPAPPGSAPPGLEDEYNEYIALLWDLRENGWITEKKKNNLKALGEMLYPQED